MARHIFIALPMWLSAQTLSGKVFSTGLSDKQLQYEAIKAQKEIALSPNTKVIIMGSGKGAPIILGKD